VRPVVIACKFWGKSEGNLNANCCYHKPNIEKSKPHYGAGCRHWRLPVTIYYLSESQFNCHNGAVMCLLG